MDCWGRPYPSTFSDELCTIKALAHLGRLWVQRERTITTPTGCLPACMDYCECSDDVPALVAAIILPPCICIITGDTNTRTTRNRPHAACALLAAWQFCATFFIATLRDVRTQKLYLARHMLYAAVCWYIAIYAEHREGTHAL